MRRRAFAIVLLTAVAIGVGAFYVYPMFSPLHVDASRVERGNLYTTVRASGQVIPKELVPVLAPASVRVVSVEVNLGQEVKKGDLLMNIEVVSGRQGPAPAPPAAPPAQQPTVPAPAASPTPSPTQQPAAPPAQSPQPSPTPAPLAQPSPTQTPPPPTQAPQQQPPPTQGPPAPPSPTQGPPLQPTPSPTQPAPPPSSQGPAPASPPPASPSPGNSYAVQPGDTLSGIAQQYGTTVEEIARSNGISNPDLIYPGQQLNIPPRQPGRGGSFAAPPRSLARIVTPVTSPVDGQVVKLEVRTDQLVPAQGSLAVVADTSALYLEVLVGKEDLPELSKGKSAQTVLDALTRETIRGKVEDIGATAVTGALGTSGYPVKVGMENPPKGIRLGMTGQTEIIGRQLTNVVYVSKRSVVEQQGGAFVYVVESDRAQKTAVTLGQKTRDYYVITSGVAEGQQVVATGLDQLEDGRRVAVDRILGPK